MIAEPVKHIYEDAVLWEIDADELWTMEQLEEGRRMFLRSPEKTAAYFWCDFFVGERLMVSTRNCYSQNPAQEWLQAWNFRPGMKWLTHEPPVLAECMPEGSWRDVAKGRIFTHRETEAAGLVFQHFAYVTESQIAFKEHYYGYTGAVEAWRRLQSAREFPVALRDLFSWVTDHTQVDTVEKCGIVPLATRDAANGKWTFSVNAPLTPTKGTTTRSIVVDGVFFQFNNTGIGRVWLETLKQWAASGFADHVWLLDRNGTATNIPGVRLRRVKQYDPAQTGDDAFMLQQICEELHAGVFISTYYTAPISTPTVMMVYDMIPELLRINDGDWQWREKELCILQAHRLVCISHSTALDLKRLHPTIPESIVSVTHLAAPPEFHQPDAAAITSFRQRHGLRKDYVLVAGERIGIHVGTQGYKNAALLFKAWSMLPADEKHTLSILCAGGKPELENELRTLAPDADVRIIRFTDEDLRLAYAGAVALVYSSLYEGFSLPVIEAMACGCPVITCDRASLREVAGDAAIMVNPWDAAQVAQSIGTLLHDPEVRARCVTDGVRQAARFSYATMSAELAVILREVAASDAETETGRNRLLWEILRRNQSLAAMQSSQISIQSLALKNAKKAASKAGKAAQAPETSLGKAARKEINSFG